MLYNVGSQPWFFNPGVITWHHKPVTGAFSGPIQALWFHIPWDVCGKKVMGIPRADCQLCSVEI